jgi:predicted ABC-type ATPase
LAFDPLLVSLLDHRPLVLALAGPNGAGKSTFFYSFLKEAGLRFVNADILAKELGIDAYSAAAIADAIRRRLVEQKESFIFETVFSDPTGDKRSLLREIAEEGYTVVLCFIGICAAEISEERVSLRVTQGGHDIPTEKITESYPRILRNLEIALRTLPFVWIFDNSDLEEPYQLVARILRGKATELRRPLPQWLEDVWPRT